MEMLGAKATLGADPARIEGLIEDTRQTLANIDFEHALELEKLEGSATDPMLKRGIEQKLRERHQQRREPYAKLVRELTLRMAHTSMALHATG
jgi:hypothetical protein